MISHWSIAGYVLGIMFSAGSFIRYYVLYPDLDKSLAYVIIGVIICCLAFLYNRQLNQGNTIKAMEDYLAEKK
jgi:hypothetical protein